MAAGTMLTKTRGAGGEYKSDQFPESSVVGIDLSRIQPTMQLSIETDQHFRVAPNVEFFIDDLEADWNFVRPFDFIYARFLTGSIKDWPRFFAQALEHMNPGGYLEACDIVSPIRSDDGTLPADCALMKWVSLLLDASKMIGAPGDSVQHYEQQMTDAGFQNVTKVEYKWPINTWPKDPKYRTIGKWSYVNMTSALHALSMMLFTQVLGWSPEEVEVFLIDVRKDLRNTNIHAYWPISY
ncbi:hypothetical protein N0V88_007161 [Collariella sp. IMI 366227]|nr:hypothetical protein N0V88_007161 [Collariella sp. IMI 366227]